MSSLMIYSFMMMNGVLAFFVSAAILFGVITFYIVMLKVVENKPLPKNFKWFPISLTLFFILSVLTPTTKQTAIIFGVPYLLDKAEDMHLDRVPVKLVDYLNAYLDQEIDKMVSKKSQDKK